MRVILFPGGGTVPSKVRREMGHSNKRLEEMILGRRRGCDLPLVPRVGRERYHSQIGDYGGRIIPTMRRYIGQ
jgi:hypothetical protein